MSDDLRSFLAKATAPIRPNSPYAALGFMNGDTIQAVNGLELRDASTALDVYTKLRSAKELQIDLMRRGQPIMLTITITQ